MTVEIFITTKTKVLKVLQVLNHFLPQQIAGTEIYTWMLSKHLKHSDIEVKIIIPNYGKAHSEEYEYDELVVHKFEETSVIDRKLIMGYKESNGLQFFKKYIENTNPDIIHFHELAGSNGISLKHVIAAKQNGAKVIFTFHLASYTCKTGSLVFKEKELCTGIIDLKKCASCYLQSKGNPKFNFFLNSGSNILFKLNIDSTKWNNKVGTALGTYYLISNLQYNFKTLIEHCDKVVVLTNWYKNILLLNGVPENKIKLISQGLTFSSVHSLNQTNSKSDFKKTIRLIFLGRISFFKGLHILIDAVMCLPKNSVTLNIYGQDDDSEYGTLLKEKSKSFANIIWQGKLQQNNVFETLQKNDVLCLCSTFSEMSPLVIQEAFAAGIPVLASNVYGNAEQITHNYNGWLFKFKDVTYLSTQLQLLIDNPSLIEEAKKNIKPPRNFDAVAKEQLEVYKEVLSAV